MDYIIIGGDGRMALLAEQLRGAGYSAERLSGPWDAAALARVGGARNVVANFPVGAKLAFDDLLNAAAPGARLCLCGPKSPDSADARIVDLWRDEALLRENACLTAEGAVSSAMQVGRRTVRGARCVVVGWGRIGSALTGLLTAMGAEVTVVTRSEAHRSAAVAHGARAVLAEDIAGALDGAELVFSTPPAMVLDAGRLRYVAPDAQVIDLASPPYGVDLQAAWDLGLRARREPGLPGRYCPESAARALMKALIRSGEAEKND